MIFLKGENRYKTHGYFPSCQYTLSVIFPESYVSITFLYLLSCDPLFRLPGSKRTCIDDRTTYFRFSSGIYNKSIRQNVAVKSFPPSANLILTYSITVFWHDEQGKICIEFELTEKSSGHSKNTFCAIHIISQ